MFLFDGTLATYWTQIWSHHLICFVEGSSYHTMEKVMRINYINLLPLGVPRERL